MFSRSQRTTKLMFSQSERGQKAFALDYCAASFVTEGETPPPGNLAGGTEGHGTWVEGCFVGRGRVPGTHGGEPGAHVEGSLFQMVCACDCVPDPARWTQRLAHSSCCGGRVCAGRCQQAGHRRAGEGRHSETRASAVPCRVAAFSSVRCGCGRCAICKKRGSGNLQLPPQHLMLTLRTRTQAR